MAYVTLVELTADDPAVVGDWNQVVRNFKALAEGPSFRIYQAAGGNPSDDTATPHEFDSEHYDTDNGHDPVSHPTRYTCKTAGKWNLGACVEYAANATGKRALSLRVTFAADGSQKTIVADSRPACATGTTQITVSTTYPLQVGDYVEMIVYQNSGAALNIDRAADLSPEMWGDWKGKIPA